MRVVWTPEAQQDRADVWDYIAADNPSAAARMDELFSDAAALLAQPHWQGKFTPRDDYAAIPLIWEHVNSHGRFYLDMNTWIDLP